MPPPSEGTGSLPLRAPLQFILEVPPEKEYVRTSRIFGASIARHFRCDEESVEDLKLALSEAVSRAFGGVAEDSSASVRLVAQATGDRLSFRIESEDPRRGAPADTRPYGWELPEDELPAEIAEGLICALFPDATFIQAEDLTNIIQFSVPLDGEPIPGPDPASTASDI